ncbi:hypothetical protein KFU94_41545 [Chloroflexi bacterium TSY]|nr:hypothetical protein [Chloroflexi bacterium TSY]
MTSNFPINHRQCQPLDAVGIGQSRTLRARSQASLDGHVHGTSNPGLDQEFSLEWIIEWSNPGLRVALSPHHTAFLRFAIALCQLLGQSRTLPPSVSTLV